MPFFDEIAKRSGQVIHFTSVSTGDVVRFPAFVTNFSDDYSIQWGSSAIFGRTDPIKSYQTTGRRITATFDILGKDEKTALENFTNYSKLIQMLYPVYSDPIGRNQKYRTIKAPPILRIKYANYIRSGTNEHGLLGCLQGVNFQPKFDAGHFFTGFDPNPDGPDPLAPPGGEMVPLSYTMNLTFEPIHETPMGFSMGGEFLETGFPYVIGSGSFLHSQPGSDPMEG